MTTASPPAQPTLPLLQFSPWIRPVTAAALVASADWLFYPVGHMGLSVAVFALALALAAVICNRVTTSKRRAAVATAILVAALLPIVEDPSVLAGLFAAFGAATFALMMTSELDGPISVWVRRATGLLVSGPLRALQSFMTPASAAPPREPLTQRQAVGAQVLAWVLPVVLGGVFLALFVAANPVLEGLIPRIDLPALLDQISEARVMLWVFVALATWSFVMVYHKPVRFNVEAPADAALHSRGGIFGDAAVLRSLVMFNALFAVQTVMDLAFLSGGIALPKGLSYADYAHRGAYPLMVTALLAGAFVLFTMRPGSANEHSRLMRMLVLAWIAQNVALVVSSMLRLELYVEVYSLTMWRAAAFIWMGLVAVGLGLLIWRVMQRWSNGWLLSATTVAAVATLYACCFVNFPAAIATYNIAHAKSYVSCIPVDVGYLIELGPEVYPALDILRQGGKKLCTYHDYNIDGSKGGFSQRRSVAAGTLNSRLSEWRGWSFRGQRLRHYFDSHPLALVGETKP